MTEQPEHADVRTEIVEALSGLLPGNELDNEIIRLSAIGVGGVLFRHHRKGSDWRILFGAWERHIRHIHDWFGSAISDKDAWLLRTDDKGRPVKLTKMHSIDQLLREADKAFSKKMETTRAKAATLTELPDDETLEMALEDGFSVVRMHSPAALDRETAVMQHCVGLGSYDRHLTSRKYGLFSLRDSFNKPHATLEIDVEKRILLQLRGKQNEIPVNKYIRVLGPFMASLDLEAGEANLAGFVITKSGQVVHCSDIPDGAVFARSLNLSRVYLSESPRIPDGIVVEGNLIVGEEFVGLVERKCTVMGNVEIRGQKVPGFSRDFTFGGDLCLEGSEIGSLPRGLHVNGSLILKDTKGAVLHEGTVVEGDLDISTSDISVLPDGLKVGRNLKAVGSALKSLPFGLEVGESAYLGGSKHLAELPRGLTVGRNVQLRGTPVMSLPEGTSIAGMLSVDADVAVEFTVAETAVVSGGVYFRAVSGVSKFLGAETMTLEEFREATRSPLPTRAVQP